MSLSQVLQNQSIAENVVISFKGNKILYQNGRQRLPEEFQRPSDVFQTFMNDLLSTLLLSNDTLNNNNEEIIKKLAFDYFSRKLPFYINIRFYLLSNYSIDQLLSIINFLWQLDSSKFNEQIDKNKEHELLVELVEMENSLQNDQQANLEIMNSFSATSINNQDAVIMAVEAEETAVIEKDDYEYLDEAIKEIIMNPANSDDYFNNCFDVRSSANKEEGVQELNWETLSLLVLNDAQEPQTEENVDENLVNYHSNEASNELIFLTEGKPTQFEQRITMEPQMDMDLPNLVDLDDNSYQEFQQHSSLMRPKRVQEQLVTEEQQPEFIRFPINKSRGYVQDQASSSSSSSSSSSQPGNLQSNLKREFEQIPANSIESFRCIKRKLKMPDKKEFLVKTLYHNVNQNWKKKKAKNKKMKLNQSKRIRFIVGQCLDAVAETSVQQQICRTGQRGKESLGEMEKVIYEVFDKIMGLENISKVVINDHIYRRLKNAKDRKGATKVNTRG